VQLPQYPELRGVAEQAPEGVDGEDEQLWGQWVA
jgi:hypothetical protein